MGRGGFSVGSIGFCLAADLHLTPAQRRKRANLDEALPHLLFFLLLLVALRFGMRNYVEHFISYWQTGGLAFLLAFGMIIHWRLRMLYDFKKLERE